MGRISIVALALLMSACGGRGGVEYSGAAGESAPVPACYFHEALAFVNHMSTTRDILVYAGVHRRAADSIVHAREGEDRIAGTTDDVQFASIEELSALPYVGPAAVDALLVHASFQCDATLRLEGTECHNYEAVQLASSTWATEATLRGIGVSAASARSLVAHRHGIDGVGGTSDDVSFVSLKHLDDVAGVGDKTIEALVSAGVDICGGAERVVFSPNPMTRRI